MSSHPQLVLHQTHHLIGDFPGVFQYLKEAHKEKGLHLFPELFLTGYPLRDLCLQKPFIENYLHFLQELDQWFLKLPKNKNTAMLLGGLDYRLELRDIPVAIFNVIYLFRPGYSKERLYAKQLLPNYDIHDEKKYFNPGEQNKIWHYQGKRIALLICEDMWHSSCHPVDPVEDLQKEKESIDLIINLSGSPYHIGKQKGRMERAMLITKNLQVPFVYVNKVGGEDGILFDGASFVYDGEKVLIQGKLFQSDCLRLPWPVFKKPVKEKAVFPEENTWESLLKPRLDVHEKPAIIPSLTKEGKKEIINALQFGIQEYAEKTGMKDLLVAFSGGIDSALVLAIAYLAKNKNQNVEAIFMPGHFTSSVSYKIVEEMCKNLNIPLKVVPIKFIHNSTAHHYRECTGLELEGISDENIQSRLRGTLLYAHSNRTGSMVLNTSNKSELAVGHCTLYGDSVGAISVLGDLYKSEVYQLAKYLNKIHKGIIPEEAITRDPSAELHENQLDHQSLPPYERLDVILEGILSYRLTLPQLIELGLDKEEVKKIYDLYLKSEYKRFQFCPIIKIHAKSFDYGYRVPICKHLSNEVSHL